MSNSLPTTITQYNNSNLMNPLVAATLILTVGVCYCVTVNTITKHNRDIDLTYGDFSLRTHSPTPDATAETAA